MTSIAHLSTTMQKILCEKANELAWETDFMERERTLTGSSFVVGLVAGWQADAQASLAGLSQSIGNAGTPISRQGLEQRFDESAVKFMKAVVKESLGEVVTGIPVPTGLLSRFSEVDVVDSSIITLPNELSDEWRGSGGYGENASRAAMKLSVRWNLVNGELSAVNVTHGTVHDRQADAHQAPVAAGSLQIRDLGYFKLDDLETIATQDAYWLIRYKVGTNLLHIDNRKVIDLENWLPQQVGSQLDTMVLLGKTKRMPARLIAERVPPHVVKQRQERIRETARQNQTEPSERALQLAHWTILLTNLPVSMANSCEVIVLARYRWQIELLFKLWKSELGIDKWRSSNPHRILVEIYAKLLVAIITNWLFLFACWDNPRRSLVQAMPSIRGLAWQWANSLRQKALLEHVFMSLRRALSKSRMDVSKKQPRAFQLAQDCYP